jgi:pimeloyl-ACP methyl ester carboxylesterase
MPLNMPPPSAPVLSGPTSRTYVSQRLRIHYADWGNPQAPPLILLHGGRDHCRSWDRVAAQLADRYHVIAPDLRGHGDSAWADGSTYMIPGYLYDLAQLIHQQALAPVTLIAHSLGGNVATRYAGLYPENVARLVAIEGLGWIHNPERAGKPIEERMRKWVEDSRELAALPPRRYKSVEEAVARMKEANPKFGDDLACHLTIHGLAQNEDGTYCWKFDPYVRPFAPYDMSRSEIEHLWGRIACPVLLMWGTQSWHTDPEKDGRAGHFRNVRVAAFEGAGHWVHHDQPERFMAELEAFLAAE